MRVFTPVEIAKHAANKYLGVLVAAKYARLLNEFPRDRSAMGEKKLPGMLAAINRRLVNGLITDEKSAAALLGQ